MQSPITRNQLSDWKQNEVTRAYVFAIAAKIRVLEEALGDGKFLNEDNTEATALAHARVIGRIEGLKDLLDVDIDTVEEKDA